MSKPRFFNSKKIQEIIRVNHAGEFGAQRIYEGQINYTKDINHKKQIKHMLDEEVKHLQYFIEQIKDRNVRPTLFLPVWSVLGYAIGACSAKLGNKATMLVTESIEKVIVEHYQDQIHYLENIKGEESLLAKLIKFCQDEANYIEIALSENNSQNFYISNAISCIIQALCKAAIFLSKKI